MDKNMEKKWLKKIILIVFLLLILFFILAIPIYNQYDLKSNKITVFYDGDSRGKIVINDEEEINNFINLFNNGKIKKYNNVVDIALKGFKNLYEKNKGYTVLKMCRISIYFNENVSIYIDEDNIASISYQGDSSDIIISQKVIENIEKYIESNLNQ